MLTTDPKIIALAVLVGIIPSLFWLWFWLKEDKEDPEPSGLIAFLFYLRNGFSFYRNPDRAIYPKYHFDK